MWICNPFALYTHCYAHIPNLCLVDLSKQVLYVRNMFASLQSLLFCEWFIKNICSFLINVFSKHTKQWTKIIKHKTWWICRAEALKLVVTNNIYIIYNINNNNAKKKVKNYHQTNIYFTVLDTIVKEIELCFKKIN